MKILGIDPGTKNCGYAILEKNKFKKGKQKIGFIKYNAFENIGNDLSFALTLLDGNNNGICISSIYGRSESRIFSKPIVKGKSLVSLSQEELESLNEALGERTNEEALTSAIVSK